MISYYKPHKFNIKYPNSMIINSNIKTILLLTLLTLTLSAASTCGGNCPANDCPTCYCGTNKNIQDISSWCSKHTWNQDCCKCIVSKLSGGNANLITHQPNGSINVGLWQVNNQ